MKLDVSSIKSILTLYDELLKNGISLVYLGEFTHEITKMFTAMSEHEMDSQSEERTTRKRVYHTMVETLQNMNKHSDEISEEGDIGKGLFMIGNNEERYYIITSNKVKRDRISHLENAIREVNAATPEELNVMYKQQLKDGKLSIRQGAGLGLIDIVRKTQQKLQYQFIPLDDEDNLFFILKVEISKSKKNNGNSEQE